jgi:6-phosphogluconolactonase (cycloisomerase 2 family)
MSDGIDVYRVDPATGAWTHVQHVGDLTNPSFLAVGPDRRCLYSVHGDEDYATAFALDRATGVATPINRAATGGRNGVHPAIDSSGRFMAVANYASGSVAMLAIAADGALEDQHQLVPLPGEPGPHRSEQQSSHPHAVVFDPSGRFLLVPDKGLDRVLPASVGHIGGDAVVAAVGAIDEAAVRQSQGPKM